LELSIETGSVSFVASDRAMLANFQQDRVGITIKQDFTDLLKVAALLALPPQARPTSTEVARPACSDRFHKRIAIHPREHQNLPGFDILSDCGYQAAGLLKTNDQIFGAEHGVAFEVKWQVPVVSYCPTRDPRVPYSQYVSAFGTGRKPSRSQHVN